MGASGEKPYKVYRGGRKQGKVPLAGRGERRDKKHESSRRDGGGSGGSVVRRPKRRWSRRRIVLLTLVAVLVLLVIWGVAGYLSVRSGVASANARLPQSERRTA